MLADAGRRLHDPWRFDRSKEFRRHVIKFVRCWNIAICIMICVLAQALLQERTKSSSTSRTHSSPVLGQQHESHTKGLHADRTTDCRRHHRHLGRHRNSEVRGHETKGIPHRHEVGLEESRVRKRSVVLGQQHVRRHCRRADRIIWRYDHADRDCYRVDGHGVTRLGRRKDLHHRRRYLNGRWSR